MGAETQMGHKLSENIASAVLGTSKTAQLMTTSTLFRESHKNGV
jgi:hypothetical protein